MERGCRGQISAAKRGLAAIEQLAGVALPASAWETLVLPARVRDFPVASTSPSSRLNASGALLSALWAGVGLPFLLLAKNCADATRLAAAASGRTLSQIVAEHSYSSPRAKHVKSPRASIASSIHSRSTIFGRDGTQRSAARPNRLDNRSSSRRGRRHQRAVVARASKRAAARH